MKDDAVAAVDLALIHGFPLDRRMWVSLTGQLSARFPTLRAHAVDLPGAGEAPPVSGPGSMEVYADRVIRKLDILRVDSCVFGGLSMGGYVVFEIWRRHPDRVRGVIMMNTRADADTAPQREARVTAMETVRLEGPDAIAHGMLPKLLAADADGELKAQVLSMMRSVTAEGMVFALEAMRDRSDSTADLSGVGVPALVISGSEDVITPAEGMEAMAAAMPRATYVTVEGTAHLTPWERPAEVAGLISAWWGDSFKR